MNIAFITLGCKVNQYETQGMRQEFAARGHNIVSDNSPFDAIVINSCTVTAESDRKTRQTVRHFRRSHPDAAIVLTGCMVQAFSDKAKALSDADIIVGNTDITKVAEYTERFLHDGEKIFEVSPHKKTERFNTPVIDNFAERTRAYMKIEDGCERFCTYCIIPTARGFVRSKSIQEIKKESQALAKNGYSEIVLVGINLSSYGKGEGINLCDAVDAVCEADGIKRIRLGSLEPDHISNEMLDRFNAQEKFCPQFHLSLQSGCDSTLKRMNRHYDTAFYTDLVTRIRSKFKDASITTDVMVGFPGETNDEFTQSLNYVEKTGFAKAHIFAYSRRAGTVAFGLPEQVSGEVKTKRSHLMSEVAIKTESNILKSQIGKVFPVLFESAGHGFAEGYTPNYLRVRVKSDNEHIGKILKVKIISAEKEFCNGEIVLAE